MSENKLDLKLKEKWLTALKSGEYKKGKSTLYKKSNNTFCCLGVLCKITDNLKILNGCAGYIEKEYLDNNNIPEFLVYDAIKESRLFELQKIYRKLAVLNDHSETFEEVIEYIEQNL